MARERFVERVSNAFDRVKVTGPEDAPVVEGVLLCGPVSANRRRYLREAFAGDRVKRYNDKPVKVTSKHGDDNGLYVEQIGTVQNARHRADGMPIGDIHVNPETEVARKFVWDAKHKPQACGMSHVVQCETRRAVDGWDEVTELVEAISVDVIGAGRAATTKGLAEGTMPKISLKQFAERFGPKWGPKKWGALTKLCEDMASYGGDASAPVMDEPAADATGDEGDLKSALMSALWPIVEEAFDSGSSSKAESALRDFIKLHAKHTGGGDDTPSETPSDDADAAAEGKKPTLKDVVAECKAVKLDNPSIDLVERLTTIRDKDTRAFVIEQAKRATEVKGETPRSTPRGAPTTESTSTSQSPTLEEIKKRIKG